MDQDDTGPWRRLSKGLNDRVELSQAGIGSTASRGLSPMVAQTPVAALAGRLHMRARSMCGAAVVVRLGFQVVGTALRYKCLVKVIGVNILLTVGLHDESRYRTDCEH
jgi:hypothetical protein